MRKFLSLFLVLLALVTITACQEDEPTEPTDPTVPTETDPTVVPTEPTETPIDYDSTVELNVALNYTSGGNLMSISYQKDSAYVSTINGKTYTKGDLLPAWERIGEKLNIDFNDLATTSDANTNAQFSRLQTAGFAGVDLVNGTGAQIGPEGVNGNFVDIGQYLEYMPNLNAFLEANPSVKVSMTSADGGIYFTPYFDGFGEMEQMFMARIDWIEDILDTTSPTFDTTPGVVPTAYERRQVETPINTTIQVANANGTVRTVTKAYNTNILDVLEDLVNPTGADVANAFRTHIQNTYGSQGYAKLSDVFAGTDAAYDTDELVALMYVVKSNPQFLTREYDTPLTAVEVMFPRESTGNRIRNLFRGMEMFGLRGVFSRHEWMYFDEDGLIQDIRYDQDFVDGVNDLSAMYADGLIIQNPEEGGNHRQILLSRGDGFITYDYNATTTAASLMNAGTAVDEDFKFQAILPPVVDWLGDGNYFHFTEATRSVKNEAWGITKAVESNPTKLFRALKLVDELYDYSTDDSVGTIHLYGPQGWTDGTIAYGSDTVYLLSDESRAEMTALAGGNHINYLRQYVGATMPIGHIRSMGLEFQTLTDQGIEGIERINTAVSAGTLKLAGLVDSDNPWYQLSPTFFPLTKSESDTIAAVATFRSIFADNSLVTMVKYGFSGAGGSLTEEAYWNSFKSNNVDIYAIIYIKAYRDAYQRILDAE
jgi:putative aldouronate transport system substrate-binding protein